MIVDYWSRFGQSLQWTLLDGIIGAVLMAYALTSMVNFFSVKGTLKSYRTATVVKTLCLPLFAAYVFQTALDIFTSDWVGALIDAFLCYTLLDDWNKIKDRDDWWKGKGTMLKRKLKSLRGSRFPAATGAGA